MANPFNATLARKSIDFGYQDYVTYKIVQKVADGFDAKNPSEFLIEEQVVEDTRVPIEEDIMSHASKVGLKNLLSGIVSDRQMNQLLEKTRSTGNFVDLTKLPDSHLGIEALAGSIDSIWNSIPAELRGSLSKEEFIRSITSKKIDEYVASELAKREAQSKESEDK